MIRSITVVNHVGDHLELPLADPYETGMAITSIDGLGPGDANIITSDYALNDGAVFNSSRLSTRNIVINLKLLGTPTIEHTRHNVYKYFPLKKPIWLIIETDRRKVRIQGYVESNVPEIFSDWETEQISIICPNPYFRSLDDQITDFSGITPEFEFDFHNGVCTTANDQGAKVLNIPGSMYRLVNGAYVAVKFRYSNTADASLLTLNVNGTGERPIRKPTGELITVQLISGVYFVFYYDGANYVLVSPPTGDSIGQVFSYDRVHMGSIYYNQEINIPYAGEIDTGVTIDMEFIDDVGVIKIYNVKTLESMTVDVHKIISKYNLEEVRPGDKIQITTSVGNKKATFIRGLDRYNCINAFDKDISWFQLFAGDNRFAYSVSEGLLNLSMIVTNNILYEGV